MIPDDPMDPANPPADPAADPPGDPNAPPPRDPNADPARNKRPDHGGKAPRAHPTPSPARSTGSGVFNTGSSQGKGGEEELA